MDEISDVIVTDLINMPKIIVKYNEYELDLGGNIKHN